MTELWQSLFYFCIGEIVSLMLAVIFRDDKRKVLAVLLIGSAISGYWGFGSQLTAIAASLGDTGFFSNPKPSADVEQSPSSAPIVRDQNTEHIPEVTILGDSEMFSFLDTAKALGQLAEEKYSLDERNKVNQTLTFTINLDYSQPVVWRWYWCAATRNILNQNLESIDVEFILNGENVTSEFYSAYFQFKDAPMKGWSCFTYEAVLKDWTSGVYYLEQNVTIARQINDGQDVYPYGYKIYQYTVTVQ